MGGSSLDTQNRRSGVLGRRMVQFLNGLWYDSMVWAVEGNTLGGVRLVGIHRRQVIGDR